MSKQELIDAIRELLDKSTVRELEGFLIYIDTYLRYKKKD